MSEFLNGSLLPRPISADWEEGYAEFQEHATLILSEDLCSETVSFFRESWGNFTRNKVELEIVTKSEVCGNSFLLVADTTTPNEAQLIDDSQTALIITTDGAAGTGACEQDLKYAWISMLQLLECGRAESAGRWLLPEITIQDKPKLGFRGIHLCVFPETSLEFIENMMMLSAFYKYSHIIIEFWGTLKFDCLAELAWPGAYSKEEVKSILEKARRMGIEPIPMFNHWGHASAGRVNAGKHVVLDQNPDLEPLFEQDGWTWCLSNPDSLALLKEIRRELRELFGHTEYFHMGCDEAYSHGSCPECRKHDSPLLLANYLNLVNEEFKAQGTRPIIWGDALLDESAWEGYVALSNAAHRTHEALSVLSKDFIINDWQYWLKDKEQTATLKHFMDNGFDVLTAPWDDNTNIDVLADMAIDNNAMGMVLTTWNTLQSKIEILPRAADNMWGGTKHTQISRRSGIPSSSAAGFLRKLRGTPASYDEAGWRTKETHQHSRI